jgi:hypothetical protein
MSSFIGLFASLKLCYGIEDSCDSAERMNMYI